MSKKQPIEWYRPTPLFLVLKTAAFSGSVMIGGMLTMALGLDMSGRFPEEWRATAVVTGISLVIIGVSYAAFRIWELLHSDHFVLELSNKGISIYEENEETFYPWQSLKKTTLEEKNVVLYINEERIPLAYQFLGISSVNLAERINEQQRKCLLGVHR